MRPRHIALLRILGGLLCVCLALILLMGVYRRVRTQILLLRDSITVEGVVTEKLVSTESSRLIPIPLAVYTVRYAYPSPQGQLRSGEQAVTRAVYQHLGGQGTPVPVTLRRDDPAISAVDPRLVFPGGAGWRLGLACGMLVLSAVLFPTRRRSRNAH